MDRDECGNGCTGSTSPGTISAWSDKHAFFNHTCITLAQLWRQPDWRRLAQVICKTVQAHGIADHMILSCSLFVLCAACWILKSRLAVKRENDQAARTSERRSLLSHIQELVIEWLPFKADVAKPMHECIESDSIVTFENVTLSAPYFFIRNGDWQCAGYDSSVRKWRRLPPFNSFLPASCMPDPDLFKEFLVCTHGGIICMNLSKGAEERLIVFNPLTGKWRELPPLKHRRNPVLMHLAVDAATQSYRVIVAGSARSGNGRLSHVTEEFDSRSWEWKRTGDLPGPDYALNEFQSGVYYDGSLYCIAFLDHEAGRGILRYNLNKAIWLKNWTYPIPFATKSSILQLVESWGELFLFSEQDNGNNNIEHCVDKVELDNINGLVSLNNVVTSKKMGGKSLEAYPEYTCVPYSEHQLCLFNTVEHSGAIYNVQNRGESKALEGPPSKGFRGDSFFSLNPMSFAIQPSQGSKI